MIVWLDDKGRVVDATGSIHHENLAALKEEHGEVEAGETVVAVVPEGQAPLQSVDAQLEEQGLPPQQSVEEERQAALDKVPPAQDSGAPPPQSELDEEPPPPESPAKVDEPVDEVEPPKPTDLKQDWVDYAAGQGYDREELEGMTKSELIEQFGE